MKGIFMDIKIYGENIEVTPAIEEHIHKKCKKFTSMVSAVTVRLKIDEQKNSIAKLDLHHNGHDYHISSNQKDMYASITGAVNKTHKLLHEKSNKNKPAHVKLAL